mmetsp:Transcript_1005/g.2040  ORF Transcript_1005/g.2040 Transcript_1005/m.2040 type:complete len:303 (+) Transcript_1005:2-910(+)
MEQATRNGGRKLEDLEQKYGGVETLPVDQVTTLMIRRVPRKYTEEVLLRELEPCLSSDSYNFIYLPWDSKRSANYGYSFINCIDAPTASSLLERLDGKSWRFVERPSEIKIVPAHVQGIALNLVHYMGSLVTRDGYAHSPAVIHNGQRISFQEAVEMYCPPEFLRRHVKDKPRLQESAAMESGIQVILAQLSTQSSLCHLVPHETPDGESLSWQAADHSTSSELIILEEYAPHEPGCPSKGVEEPWWARSCDLTRLLASDAYFAAWKKLNEQLQGLEASPVMDKGRLDPSEAPQMLSKGVSA